MREAEVQEIEEGRKTESSSDKRESSNYWFRWIKSAEKAGKRHRLDTNDAWREYENLPSGAQTGANSRLTEVQRTNPIYFTSCKIIEPAFYSRTPKLTTSRRFGLKDKEASLGSVIIERLGDYALDTSYFDDVVRAAVKDFIHGDKATTQACYEAEFDEVEDRIDLQPAMDDTGQVVPDVYLMQDGTEWNEPEVYQDETGFFGKQVKKVPIKQRVYLSQTPYDEVLHTPDAKCEAEITEKAYYFKLTKDEAKSRFEDEVYNKINWKRGSTSRFDDKGEDRRDDNKDQETLEEYIEGFECWSKPNKRVYWVSKQYVDGILDAKDDPYGLKGFFPSPPFIIGSKPSKSLYPTPVYIHVYPIIKELHNLTDRIFDLIDGIRRRCLVDGANEELVAALNSMESGEFMAVKNLTSIVEKGGIQNMIYWVPVQELVQALAEAQQLDEKFKNDFFEAFGVPDVLRGTSDPIETLGAQELKTFAAHDRFKDQKKMVQELAKNSLQMLIDLMLGLFTDEKIMQIVGFKYMSQEEQAMFPQVLHFLRNDEEQEIRIDIDTDSMSFLDERIKAAQVNQAVQTVTAGLDSIANSAKIDPQFARVGLHALLFSLESMLPSGREFQEGVETAVQSMIEKLEQPEDPGPDYNMLNIQLLQQQNEIQAQKNMMEAQLQSQKAALEGSLQAQKNDMEAHFKSRELDQKELQISIDAQQQSAKQNLEELKFQISTMTDKIMIGIESQRVEIEAFKARMQAAESSMEEIRLAREADLEAVRQMVDVQSQALAPQQQVQQPQAAPITINNIIPEKGKRRAKIVYDEAGNAEIMTEPTPEEAIGALLPEP